jgi:hypothetical protein
MAHIKSWRKGMKTDREATEPYPEKMEANPEEIKFVAMHEEVPAEEAAVKTDRELKKRGHSRQLRKRTQGDDGSQKKLAAARRGMKRSAIPNRTR